jgi:hypothetical protein
MPGGPAVARVWQTARRGSNSAAVGGAPEACTARHDVHVAYCSEPARCVASALECDTVFVSCTLRSAKRGGAAAAMQRSSAREAASSSQLVTGHAVGCGTVETRSACPPRAGSCPWQKADRIADAIAATPLGSTRSRTTTTPRDSAWRTGWGSATGEVGWRGASASRHREAPQARQRPPSPISFARWPPCGAGCNTHGTSPWRWAAGLLCQRDACAYVGGRKFCATAG